MSKQKVAFFSRQFGNFENYSSKKQILPDNSRLSNTQPAYSALFTSFFQQKT
jgi:hypothetical protein